MKRDALIESHQHVVVRLARQLACRTSHGITLDDLSGAGYLGLVEAAQRYDTEKNDSFEAYARTRVRGAMLDEIRRHDRLPRKVRDRVKRVDAAKHVLSHKLMQDPTISQVSREVGASVDDLHNLQREVHDSAILGFDDVWAREVSDAFIETIRGTQFADGEQSAIARQTRDQLITAFEAMPPRLRQVISMYWGQELTLREIGDILKVTEGRVSQLRSAAMGVLAKRLARDVAPEDLRLLFQGAA